MLTSDNFEPSIQQFIVEPVNTPCFSIAHMLPNQWVVAGNYEGIPGLEKYRSAVSSIKGGVKAIFFHDKLKGLYKTTVKFLASELRVPALKHKRLKDDPSVVINKSG